MSSSSSKKLYLNGEEIVDIIIPDNVTSIGDCQFAYCASLKKITIPNSVTRIGDNAFAYCASLSSITIPDSVTRIGAASFAGCTSLESITLPFIGFRVRTAKETNQFPFGYIFGGSRYNGGIATNQEYYGSSTTSTVNSTYYLPKTLKSVTITGGNILCGAFQNCSSLESITIGNGVTYIDNRNTFTGCIALTIYCEATSKPNGWAGAWNSLYPVVWNYKNNDIAEDGNIYVISDGIRYALKDGIATVVRQPQNIRGVVIIPEKIQYRDVQYAVTSIDMYAFFGCSSLNGITIPDSVISIGDCAFENCNTLKSVTIPNRVTSISNGAFRSCVSLESIEIPDSVTSIGVYAFELCSSLTSVTIPDSVTSIAMYAFNYCSSLISITIPDSVISIEAFAFEKCKSLTIYCEAEEMPSEWNSAWNYTNCPVVWGYKPEN